MYLKSHQFKKLHRFKMENVGFAVQDGMTRAAFRNISQTCIQFK